MKPIKARVQGGRLVLDEPTDLPEGTEVVLLPLDDLDDLDDEGRRALHAALEASLLEADRGDLIPANRVMAQLFER